MTRKDLQEKYNIIGNNNDISLYRKKGEYDYGVGYCGNIQLKNGKALFNGNSYKDIDSLDNALCEWEKSLPWPVDTYNPMIIKSANLESRIIWYLTKKLGFKQSMEKWQIRYVKNIGPSCQLYFEIDRGRRGMSEDTLTLITSYGGVYFTQEVDNADSAVAMISAIVRENIFQMSSDMVNTLSILPDTDVPSDIEAFVEDQSFKKVDFKTTMIALLEKELKKLKGENE